MSIECPYCKNYGYLHELEYKRNDGAESTEWIWKSYRCQDCKYVKPATLLDTTLQIPSTIFFTLISKPFEIITNIIHTAKINIYSNIF